MAHLETDVLVVGSGAAGMYAAIAAARAGAKVILVDKSLIGRGGATIMAQMTVAAAVGEQEADHWTHHLKDTLEAGRGLNNERLAAVLCEEASARIRELDDWKVGWARSDGHMSQVKAPGHGRERCVYVDFLNTGPAIAKTLRTQVARQDAITRLSGVCITDLVTVSDRVAGAVAFEVASGTPVTIAAKAVILAAGGLTRLYRRNSASLNMGGDSYALALRAGAELIDMEFVQFFPIGHLAPRLVGMDPIMWDPFRYKLGGRLLNGNMEEFIDRYGATDDGVYTAPRDVASLAILKEVEAGRGSPSGGAYLSFQHIPEADLRAAFGPIIDRLSANGIDLTKQAVEVAPIAHYHMGGICVDETMETRVKGLFAAGEAVGGANGANRLSGNAITEAFVFGERAGRFAAAGLDACLWTDDAGESALAQLVTPSCADTQTNLGKLMPELQSLLWDKVGLLRDQAHLQAALDRLRDMRVTELPALRPSASHTFEIEMQDWFDLRSALLTAEAIALAALKRTESRGAHQREDHPATDPAQERNQTIRLVDGALSIAWRDVVRQHVEPQPLVMAK